MASDRGVTFERHADLDIEAPTLVEGLPGHGLVASITVDQITEQLGLEHVGSIHAEDFPRVASYADGRVRDPVRIYAGAEPALMTIQSDIALPAAAFDSLGHRILEELTSEFDRALFLAGAPAQNESQVGTIGGIATTDDLEAELDDAGVELIRGSGVVGGITGSLLDDCYRADVPAAALIVHANPRIPDPRAARSVIENALEPLVQSWSTRSRRSRRCATATTSTCSCSPIPTGRSQSSTAGPRRPRTA
jgi:uncharacterized protein